MFLRRLILVIYLLGLCHCVSGCGVSPQNAVEGILDDFVVQKGVVSKVEVTFDGRPAGKTVQITAGQSMLIKIRTERDKAAPWSVMTMALVTRSEPRKIAKTLILGLGDEEREVGKKLVWNCREGRGYEFHAKLPEGEYDAFLCWQTAPKTIEDLAAREKDGRIDRTTILHTTVQVLMKSM